MRLYYLRRNLWPGLFILLMMLVMLVGIGGITMVICTEVSAMIGGVFSAVLFLLWCWGMHAIYEIMSTS